MRLALRFILPLLAILAIIAYAAIPIFESLNRRWAIRDLDVRSRLIANTLEESLNETQSPAATSKLFARATQDERLFAIGLCDSENKLQNRTEFFPIELKDCNLSDPIVTLKNGPVHIAREKLASGSTLLIVHDMSFVERRSTDTKRYFFYLFIVLSVVISLVTVTIAQLSWRHLLKNIRGILLDGGPLKQILRGTAPELMPLARDLRSFLKEREDERRHRDESQIAWSPKALKDILKNELAGDEVITVSNREPYIHVNRGGKIEVQSPASGLVTALEPVMRACSGTWIAHGSGSADKATVDSHDRVWVPPEEPAYQIRRVWLTKEEEQGYYYGFANEGLWPLCHVAYTRPLFRSSDWDQYVAVNRKFADVVVEEADTENPVILVQDYHFALLPRMIRDKLPNATIITFWHIPWPNPETFGICPWREEIVRGLLGSSILGFHTRFHVNNFIDTVDRLLEARIDRETSTISLGGHLTAIKSYPISIEWPPRNLPKVKNAEDSRRSVRLKDGLSPDTLVGVGVDRLDYTKGILERFLAIEKLLESKPEWIGKFSFIQIAAPSRSTIEQYQSFEAQVRAAAARINGRFGTNSYRPIVLKVEHHDAASVFEYFRASDICMVTSLHDGMNLVAKEFVAAREDELGVLILSQFTGASRELQEALIVNPYDIDQCAAALHVALSMGSHEQRARMRSMRSQIQEFNVYRWAGRMLIDASRIRYHERLRDRIRDTEARL